MGTKWSENEWNCSTRHHFSRDISDTQFMEVINIPMKVHLAPHREIIKNELLLRQMNSASQNKSSSTLFGECNYTTIASSKAHPTRLYTEKITLYWNANAVMTFI